VENASKALMMAGAVLITVIVFGLFMYFYARLQEFPEQQEQLKEIEQIAKFNQEYESYYKKKMYGVDVVTVMNKVISNNNKYVDNRSGKYLKSDDNYFINVSVKLNKTINSYAEHYINGTYYDSYYSGTIKGYKYGDENKEYEKTLGEINYGDSSSDKLNITLLKETTNQFFTNGKVEVFFSDAETVKILTTSGIPSEAIVNVVDEFNYTLVHSGFTDFKRRQFRCDSIEYNPETSRVSALHFVEISNND